MIKTLKKLLVYAKPWRWTLVLTVFVLVAGSLLNLVTPAVVRRITAQLAAPASDTQKNIIILAVILIIAYLLRAFFRFLAIWQAHVAAWSYVPSLTLRVYDHIQGLSPKWYTKNRVGDIMSRVLTDTRALETLIAHALPDLISNAVIVVGVSVMLFTVNPTLAAITLVPIPFVFYASTFYSKKVNPLFKINSRFFGKLSSNMQDRISGMKEIQAFSAEKSEHEKMSELCDEYSRVNIHANFASGIYNPTVELLTSAGTVLVAAIGGTLALRGRLSAADIVGFFMYLSLFYTPLTTLGRLAEDIQTCVASGERVLAVLETKSDITQSDNAHDIGLSKGEVTFDNVSFDYSDDDKGLLKNISFNAKPGTMTAIIGATGAGKTTLISLLERFYDTDSGKILLDGTDIKDLTLECLRNNISVVLQDVFLFNGTIADNIRFGAPDATDSELMAASKAAHAHEFICQMPDGYNTVVGERGARLSGGQKQRIAIARALLRPSPILVLDEATSAVDNETEELIRRSLEEMYGKKTLIVIAHRLSTVRNADNIIVIENGSIKDSGTHDELINREGLYRRLWLAQKDHIDM